MPGMNESGERSLADLRRRLGEALRDPARRQLAHIALLDVAMAVTERLQARGLSPSAVGRAAEEIAAFLQGDSDALPDDLTDREAVVDALHAGLQAAAQNPAFARVLSEQRSGENPKTG